MFSSAGSPDAARYGDVPNQKYCSTLQLDVRAIADWHAAANAASNATGAAACPDGSLL